MGTGTNPFTDLAEVQGPLYATPDRLTSRFPRALIAAIDLSAALLTAARNRTGSPGRAAALRADFHRLPSPTGPAT
jgi:trans-aconitate methyltransferase